MDAPEADRKAVYRRLYLEFHPDKNPHRVDIATEAFKFLKNQIDVLEEGGDLQTEDARARSQDDSYFYQNFESNEYFKERAKQYHNFEQEFSGYHAHASSDSSTRGGSRGNRNRGNKGGRKNPQPGPARRWIVQARHDLDAVSCDQGSNNYEWACYKCHQAAEKATQAAQLKVDASLDEPSYETLAECECDDLTSRLRQIVGPADSMQYPDSLFKVPHDAYTADMARLAFEVTTEIVNNCNTFVNNP